VQRTRARPQERIHLPPPGGQVGLRGGVLGRLGPDAALAAAGTVRRLATITSELACPVRGECLAHALAIGERHGVWGGLTTSQRLGLLAEQEKAA
jgi:hypothetical protein